MPPRPLTQLALRPRPPPALSFAPALPFLYPPTHHHHHPLLLPDPPTTTQSRAASHAAQGRANKAAPGPGKRLGAKRGATELVVPGTIIFRQRGTHWFPGENVGMGRDHTIFAKEKGYVCFYKDRWRGIGYGGAGRLGGRDGSGVQWRKYIGIVFEKGESLPRPAGAKRMRRLGLEMREREDAGAVASTEAAGVEDAGALVRGQSVREREAVPQLRPKLKMSPGYQFRESNWSIGRAAERANVKVREFKRGDRFLAWRKRTARKARVLETKSMKSRKARQAKGSKKK